MNNTRLRNILAILGKYDPKGYIAVEHDEMWIGGPDPDSMQGYEVDDLENAGCTWDENNESWHVFV